MAAFRALERPRYFTGKVLADGDLQLEQDYFIARLRRQNRLLRGWGVVAGLRVSIDGASTPSAVIAPGIAIDCAGNEIVVDAERRIALDALDGHRYVTLRYEETAVDPVPSSGGTEFSRIREGAGVALATSNPNTGHRGIGRGTAGCGDAHAVCIATLCRRGTRWVVLSASHGA